MEIWQHYECKDIPAVSTLKNTLDCSCTVWKIGPDNIAKNKQTVLHFKKKLSNAP